jgi:hypothetical protein
MTEWQPIETAPKDGTQILVCGTYSSDIAIVRFREHDRDWRCVSDGFDVIESQSDFGTEYRSFAVPTHWMPLPSLPGETK